MSIRTKREAFFGAQLEEPSSGSYVSSPIAPPVTVPSSTSSYLSSRRGLGDLYSSSNGHSLTTSSDIPLSNGALSYSSTNSISSEEIIGFANLPNQIHRNAIRKGFDFNIIVVGCSGLGKSTFINSLFLSEIYSGSNPGPSQRVGNLVPPPKTLKTHTSSFLLKEGGVELRLRVVDTPGFGDNIDNSDCWQPIVDELEARFDQHMRLEQSLTREAVSIEAAGSTLNGTHNGGGNHNHHSSSDRRIHCCLYFVQPTGHGLRRLDVEFLRRIQDKVNVVPVLAKADTLTVDECRQFKRRVREDLKSAGVRVYEFPDAEIQLIGDAIEQSRNRGLAERQPFAVVGSNCLAAGSGGGAGSSRSAANGGGAVRARVYPWGTVEVDNLEHNDFIALRTLLLSVHMRDLIESTELQHYETHRQMRLKVIMDQGNFVKDPLIQLEEERLAFEANMSKSQADMEQLFEQKLREKKNTLKDLEACNLRRCEQMQKQLTAEEEELEERMRAFQLERQAWESSVGAAGAVSMGGDLCSGQLGSNSALIGGLNSGMVGGGGGGVASTLPANCADFKAAKPEKKKKGLF